MNKSDITRDYCMLKGPLAKKGYDCLLYTSAMLLDRASISKQNGYVEPDGTIRLYFTVEQAQERLHRSRQCVTRIFRELEYCGLIIRKKQRLGRPSLITLNYPADAKLIVKGAQP